MLPKNLNPYLVLLLSPILLQSPQDLLGFQMSHRLTHASNGWVLEDCTFLLLPQPVRTRMEPWISRYYAFKSLTILKIAVLPFDMKFFAGGRE